jgi:hypothetical protein
MIRNVVLALALLAGSAEAAPDSESVCPSTYTQVMPTGMVCATGIVACWADYGALFDSMSADCSETGYANCEEFFPALCNSMCLSSMSSISQLQADGKTFKEVPITSLKVGDMVESRDANMKPVAAKVTLLPHNDATTGYVAVHLAGHAGSKAAHPAPVTATPHHTFPLCGGEVKTAKDLHAGDCLNTVEGPRKVSHTEHVPAAAGEQTCVETPHTRAHAALSIWWPAFSVCLSLCPGYFLQLPPPPFLGGVCSREPVVPVCACVVRRRPTLVSVFMVLGSCRYTVELEGEHSLVVANGVVTHARPEMKFTMPEAPAAAKALRGRK